MPTINDQAVALRRLDYSETSQVLLFLTREHGPRRLIAKGIKRGSAKKFAVGIDLLEHGQLAFASRTHGDSSLGTLTEWQQVDIHSGLRADLGRLYAGQYAAEVTAALTEENDPHPELFDALISFLQSLARGEEPFELLARYQITLLTSIGVWPDLTRCMLCSRIAPPGRAAFFSAHQGGLVCRACVPRVAEKRKTHGSTLDALRQNQITGETAPAAFEFLDYTIAHTMEIGRAHV